MTASHHIALRRRQVTRRIPLWAAIMTSLAALVLLLLPGSPATRGAQAQPRGTCVDRATLEQQLRAAIEELPFIGQADREREAARRAGRLGVPGDPRQGPLGARYVIDAMEAGGAGVVPLTYRMTPVVSWYMSWGITPVDGACRDAGAQEQEFRAKESFCRRSGGTPDELRAVFQPFGGTSCIGSNVSSLDGGRSSLTGNAHAVVVNACVTLTNDAQLILRRPAGLSFDDDPPGAGEVMRASAEKWNLEVARILLDAINRACGSGGGERRPPSGGGGSPPPGQTTPPSIDLIVRIYVDKPVYRVGETIHVCVEQSQSGDTAIIKTAADDEEDILYAGFTPAATFCLDEVAAGPTGVECMSVVFDGSVGEIYLEGDDSVCYDIVGAGAPPSAPPAPPSRPVTPAVRDFSDCTAQSVTSRDTELIDARVWNVAGGCHMRFLRPGQSTMATEFTLTDDPRGQAPWTLTINHLSSDVSATLPGHSPVRITLNGRVIWEGSPRGDVAAGTPVPWTVTTLDVSELLQRGSNTLRWEYLSGATTHYWLKSFTLAAGR
jgi:hypothetical protein